MAFTIVPIEDYEELMNGVSEASSSKAPFSYSEMEKNSSTYRSILSYMKTTNVKKIGTGSARTAFFLPPGSVKENSLVPSCFKVAKNKIGIRQNEEEIKLFNLYGKKKLCFPELFDWDSKNQFFMQTEVGRPLKNGELKGYFEDWNNYVLDMKMDQGGRYAPYYLLGLNVEEPYFERNDEYTYHLFKCIQGLNVQGKVAGWAEDPDYVISEIEDIAKEFPKYKPLVELMRFSIDGGWDKGLFDDLSFNVKNWAMIDRDGEKCLVPIDFGFTYEVRNQFYE